VLAQSGAANQVVTDLVGDINATNLTGSLSVTTADNRTDNSISITAGSGNVVVGGGNASDTVTVTGLNTDNQTFSAQSSTSKFNITAGANNQTITGSNTGNDTINGGSGTDTVSYAGGSNVTVTIGSYANQSGSSTGQGTDSFSNIESLVGTSGTDILRSMTSATDEVVTLTGANAGSIRAAASTSSFGFSSFEQIDLQGGNDTLISTVTSANNLNVSATNSGTLGSMTFSNLENVTLGSGADTATISAAIGSVKMGSGNDTVNLSSKTIATTIDGEDGNDTLFAQAGNISSTLNINAANAGTLDATLFSSFETIDMGDGVDTATIAANTGTLNMGAGNDSITLNTAAAGTINADAGDDSATINGTAAGNLNMGTGNDSITLNNGATGTINADAGNDSATITGTSAGNLYMDAGNDNVNLSSGAEFNGSIALGEGDNRLILGDNSVITGNVTALGGNDYVEINSGEIKGTINLGEGNNTLKAVGAKTENIAITGGNGSDTMIFEGQSALTGSIKAGGGNDVISLGTESLPIGANVQLAAAITNLKTTLHDAASNGKFATAASSALNQGSSSNPDAIQNIATKLSANDFSDLPSISLVSGKNMDGALGAYVASEDTIVVNEEWLATASTNDVNAVLVEEFGHFLDTQVNGANDTPGDEGEAFSRALGYVTSGGYPTDTNGSVSVVLPDGSKVIGEANSSTPVASTNPANHLSIDGEGGFDTINLPGFDLNQAADFARTGGFGEFVNYTDKPEGETMNSTYLNMSITNVEEVTWDKTSQETAAVSDVSLMGVQDTTVSSGADLATVYGVVAKSAANSISVGDGVSSYGAGISLGVEDSSFTAGDALSMTITFGGKSSGDAQSVADDANAVAVGYGVGLDNTDLSAGSSLDLVIKDASQVAADAFTTTGNVFAVASNDGIGATDLLAIGDSAVDAVFTLNLTNSASAITTDGTAEAVGWMAATGLDDSSFTSGGIGLINVTATGLNGVNAESITSGATADAFSAMVGVNNTSFDFADTSSTIASNLTNDTSASSSSIFGRAMSGLSSTVFGLFGGTTGGDTITNAQSVSSIITDHGFADAASVGGMASSIASHSATGISGYDITTTENLLLTSKNTVNSTASSSVVDA
ncbi:hypothetical protein, partial [Synechococcus sp. UW140]|uniref:beta strand repeat-containing protein n=1 Tax=Synechococcus sp. UW140 TaxID=368503 RepID=UPI00313845CA